MITKSFWFIAVFWKVCMLNVKDKELSFKICARCPLAALPSWVLHRDFCGFRFYFNVTE